jgi:gliding motility-associated-like protein
MQRFCLMILIIISGIKTQAQTNLVPNGDFEENTGCPIFSLLNLSDWIPCGTPDYFHSCSQSNSLKVPSNNFGFQFPESGYAYVGIIIYLPSFSENTREYLKVKLKKKLKKSCYYFIILYYSNAEYTEYLSNEFGVLFTVNDIACDITKYKLINLNPSIQNHHLTDTSSVHWMKYMGIYKAQGDEEWMIIGNFINDYQSIVYINNPIYKFKPAYLYIDNVQLYDLCEDSTLISGIEIKPAIPTGITLNYDGKNDYLKLMNPELFNSFRIRVFDRWGTKLFESNTPYFSWNGSYNGERVPIGVYQWQAEYTTINNPTVQYTTGNVTVLY